MPSYLVVGASRGIGLAFVKQLSAIPENVVFAGVRNIETSKHLQPLLSRSNVHAIQLDMTDIKSLEAAVQMVGNATQGQLDVLIINAGLTDRGKLSRISNTYEELVEEHRLFESNVLGPTLTMKAFIPLVLRGETKKIIAISSGNADTDLTLKIGAGMGVAYTATKAALNAYIARLSVQYRQDDLIFRAICPGPVDTGETMDPPVTNNADFYAPMIKQLKPFYPDFDGPMTPVQSVDMVLQVIENTTMVDSGTFVSHHGNKNWI